jgi:hypothetical protein
MYFRQSVEERKRMRIRGKRNGREVGELIIEWTMIYPHILERRLYCVYVLFSTFCPMYVIGPWSVICLYFSFIFVLAKIAFNSDIGSSKKKTQKNYSFF